MCDPLLPLSSRCDLPDSYESYHLKGPPSRQLCQQILGVANEMPVIHLLVELYVILQVITR